jgi:Zn-dependent protease
MTTPQPALTQSAHQILNRANLLAQQRNQAFITPEHILLALLQTPRNSALTVLSALGVDLDRVAQRLTDQLGPPQRPSAEPHQLVVDRGGSFSTEARAILNDAIAEARDIGSAYIDERVILSGILRRPGMFACQTLIEQGVTLLRARAVWNEGFVAQPSAASASTSWRDIPLSLSPVFLGLVVITAGAAYVAYLGGTYARIALFVFVTGGWLMSLSLHEFGHALVAYLGGDRSVADKGYLSLNVFKYTHPILSIVFPVLILILGNIGLPGGAVYVNPGAIRSRWMRSLMSAAGPIMTGLCTLALVPLFYARFFFSISGHTDLWAGLAFLVFLQLSALFFNLLPIPGLDGFGIIEPFLPQALLGITYTIRRFTFFILLLLFFNDTPVSEFFYTLIGIFVFLCGVPSDLIRQGFILYRFWAGG